MSEPDAAVESCPSLNLVWHMLLWASARMREGGYDDAEIATFLEGKREHFHKYSTTELATSFICEMHEEDFTGPH